MKYKRTFTEKSMFFLSWLTALGSGTDSVCLITLTDSPEMNRRWIKGELLRYFASIKLASLYHFTTVWLSVKENKDLN